MGFAYIESSVWEREREEEERKSGQEREREIGLLYNIFMINVHQRLKRVFLAYVLKMLLNVKPRDRIPKLIEQTDSAEKKSFHTIVSKMHQD